MEWFKYEATDKVTLVGQVLEEGILAINKETGEFKIGDNVTAFSELPVFGTSFLQTLPTVDPAIAGALWNDDGVVLLSAGP